MPTFYAHRRFGADLQKAVPALAARIGENGALFDIGVYGPDPFFFYHILAENRVIRLGMESHGASGREVLRRGKALLTQSETPEKTRAYLYGLLAHFLLDSVCHPAVHDAVDRAHVSHDAVETSFDRALLLRDGVDPLGFDPCGNLVLSRENAAVIAPFYPPATRRDVEKSLAATVRDARLLYHRSRFLRAFLDRATALSPRHSAVADTIMTDRADPRCAESDRVLYDRWCDALAAAPAFYAEADAFLNNAADPGPLFDVNFSGTGRVAPF